MDLDDRLELRVVSARDLPEVEGGDCNPFVVVRCGSEAEQTHVVNSSQNPEWTSQRMIFLDVAENDIDHVVLSIYHKSLGGGADVPLGQAVCYLRTVVLSPGIEQDDRLELGPMPGQTQECKGSLRIELSYFVGDNDLLDDDDSDDEDVGARPNMLVGVMHRAKMLRSTVDAYCAIQCDGKKARSPVVRRTTGPLFDHAFKIPVSDGTKDVLLKLKDKGVLSTKLIGECSVPMVEVAAHGGVGLQRWFRLVGAGGSVGGEERGQVEVSMAWVYDRKYARSAARLLASASDLLLSATSVFARKVQEPKQDDEEAPQGEDAWMLEESEDMVPLKLTSKEQEEVNERREAGAMMADRAVDELNQKLEERLEPGDYQVQVHVIECRDLKAEDLNGLSDPYARVKVLDRVRKTRVIKKCTSCVFDEVLYFSFRDMKPNKIAEACIDISILDYDTIGAHALIGVTSFTCGHVHQQEGHEIYRKWCGVVDNKNADDNGYQGYVKVSVTVLGPGDEQKAHDVDREYQEEVDREMESGDAGGMGVQGPADIVDRLVFLVVYVWEAEDLPQMDASGFFSQGGIEAYVRCEFCGVHCRTSSVSVSGKGNLSPDFWEELWLPVTEPTDAATITVGLWDYNSWSRDRAVAHLHLPYAEIKRDSRRVKLPTFGLIPTAKYVGPRPRWQNLYGAPLGIQGKRGALQNRFGDEASTYRGRVLLSCEILERPPRGAKTIAHVRSFRHRALPGLKPSRVKYHLRCLAVLGSEIPAFRSPSVIKAGISQMRLVVSIGQHQLMFGFKKNERGLVEFHELQQLKNIELPVLLDELPDVCIYLQRGPPKVMTVCYARVPAAALLKEQFRGGPRWIPLIPDKCRTKRMGGVDLENNPGAVLLKLGLGLSEDAICPEFAWNEQVLLKAATLKKPFAVRVYVYQARHLPASDENGLLDPYVKVRFCGSKQKTKKHEMTTSPLFYETLQFSEELPEDPLYGPDVVLQVWDADAMGLNTHMALLRMPLCELEELSSEAARPPEPTWRALQDTSGEPCGGELLCCGARIRKHSIKEKTSRPEPIVPPLRQAWIEVTVLGVRQLKTYNLQTPSSPYVRVAVPGPGDGGGEFRTLFSSKPNARNANFIYRRVMSVELPEQARFGPQLDLRVYNAGVLSDTLLGATSVDLSHKLPWNPHEYVAPQSELFDDAEQRAREAEAEKKKAHEALLLEAQEEDEFADDSRAVGVSFGANEDHDEDDSSDGESIEHHELERCEGVVVTDDHRDAGTSAFDTLVECSLPEIREDVFFREEQLRIAEEIKHEHEENEQSQGLLGMLGARFAAATETGLDADVEYKLSELPITFPSQWAAADYLKGREWWVKDGGLELETYLKTRPFETYPVYRGKRHPNPAKSTLREVGHVKAIIRVLDEDPQFENEPFFPMVYAIRVYCIRGANLQPVAGSTCDPYIRAKLGKDVETRDHKTKTLKPDIYETFEFRTVLPGPAELKLQVKDWSRFKPVHEVIGETKIDLEDRWFHRKWQALDAKEEGSRNKLKPIEIRALKKDGSLVTRGQLHVWVEVRPEREVLRELPVLLEAPEPREFEVRIICWKTKEVPNDVGDYFAEFELGASDRKRSTDIHLRCRTGRASWNWRVKMPITLPLTSPEQGRLSALLWNKNFVTGNDVVGQTQLDLYRWLLKAYREDRSVNVFKEINDALRKKRDMEAGRATADDLASSNDSSGDESGSDGDGTWSASLRSLLATLNIVCLLNGAEVARSLTSSTRHLTLYSRVPIYAGDEETKEEPTDDTSETSKKKKKKKKKKTASEASEAPEPDKREMAEKDALFFVEQLKTMAGVGPLDATAQWLRLTFKDQKRHRVVARGSIAISVEILPKEDADNRPAGMGISEPNQNPTLPPRTGRMALSTNPLSVLKELFGPRCVMIFCCCFCLCVFFVLWFYLGMYYVNIYTELEALGFVGGDDTVVVDDAVAADDATDDAARRLGAWGM